MITLIIGPMMAGKSSEMIRLLVRAQIAGKKVVLVRPKIDDRGFLTHDRKSPNIDEISCDKLLYNDLKDYDVIGIDEGQFYKDSTSFLYNTSRLADEGKHVIVTGLNGTSERGQFETVQKLIPHAEEIVKLNAICMDCGSEYGTYSYYKAGDKTEDVKVGDSNEYIALCRECYNKR